MEKNATNLRSLLNEIKAIKEEALASIHRINHLREIKEQLANETINDNNDKNKANYNENSNTNLFHFHEQIIVLNIGGKIFQTTRKTLSSRPTSLFHTILNSDAFKEKGIVNTNNEQIELFFDRSPKYFKYILSFLRTNRIDFNYLYCLKSQELQLFIKEVLYYSIDELASKLYLKLDYAQCELVRFNRNDQVIETENNIATLNNFEINSSRSLFVPYHQGLILELKRVVNFSKIEIQLLSKIQPRNHTKADGVYSSIFTSLDKTVWTYIGVIPPKCQGRPFIIDVISSKCKYIQFINTRGQISIGYCKIIN